MLTFLIKPPGRKPYTKCLPSNAAAIEDAQKRYPGTAPASVVNLVIFTGHVDCMPNSDDNTRRFFAVFGDAPPTRAEATQARARIKGWITPKTEGS